jgi:DNA packaging protein, QLRG family
VSALLTLSETKNFLKVDHEEDDALITSLIITSRVLVEGILRYSIDVFDNVPEPIKQAALIIVGTLYEERQVNRDDKSGLDIKDTLDLVRRMLFAYRKERF